MKAVAQKQGPGGEGDNLLREVQEGGGATPLRPRVAVGKRVVTQ